VRGRVSVEVAKRVLSGLGYRVVEESIPIVVKGEEVGEADLIVEDEEGRRYAVEVKAGKLSVSGVRQAKVNAKILGLEPMVVARGYADEAARALAEELGVRVVCLADLIAISETDLYLVVKAAVEEVLCEFLLSLRALKEEEVMRTLEAIAESDSFSDAASKLGISVGELGRILGSLRRDNVLPPISGYKSLRAFAAALVTLKRLLEVRKIP